jgi:CBS domain containing-hemolysin-like protein
MEVVDIMVPRANVSAIDVNATKDELIKLLSEKPHARIPVYDGNLDNVCGVIYTKNIVANLASHKAPNIKEIMMEPLVISPAMRVLDLLLLLRKSRIHIAFVVDEFGGIDGIVTINDLIEAIVGKISEESTLEVEPQLIERPDGTVIADAGYAIVDFEKIYGNVFQEDEANEDVDTLAGLITNISGHMPARGEVIRHSSNIEFEILEADPRRIIRVRIKNLPPKQATAN